MAAYPTLLDIAQSTGTDGIASLIEEVIKYTPEIQMGAARTINGTQYKSTVRVGLPGVSFRQANLGGLVAKSTYEQRLFDAYITDTPWMAEKAVALAHPDGAPAYIATEAKGIVLAQMILLAKQFYYGKPSTPGDNSVPFSDPLGFPGLLQMYDAANMTVDAGGTTANTATSVWAYSWGDEGCQWLYGGGTNPLQMSDITEVVLPDANGNLITYYHQQLLAWVGMKLGSLKRAACIKNVTADSGHTLTDGMLTDLLSLFPVGYTPDAIFMTRRSMSQLIKSRIAVNASAYVGAVPGFVTDFDGIPVYRTDSIQNTEALR